MTCFSLTLSGQRIKNENQIIEKWSKATINILCYPEEVRKKLLLLDDALALDRIDSTQYEIYVQNLINLAKTGTAIWLAYQEYNFLVSARHVLEDKTNCVGCSYNQIIIVESDTASSIDLDMYHRQHQRNYIFEIGHDIDMVIVDNPNLYKFSSVKDDLGVINLDSAYYAYGLLPFLRRSGYEPVKIDDIDTKFRVKPKDAIIAIGYPEKSIIRMKSNDDIPSDYALITSPIFTLPVVSRGMVFDVQKGQNMFLADIFTYHGFSGGPVINKKGKLIGLTQGLKMPIVSLENRSYLDWSGRFIKASLIIPLLDDLVKQLKSTKFNRMEIQRANEDN